jgi:hypothetical protein
VVDEVVCVQVSGAVQIAAGADLRECGSGVGQFVHGLVARIVEPMAPYFAALRRVSSKAERA